MGGSSKQVTGYRYFANFLLFIGNPIEKVLGINFDKRGWQTPLIDEKKNPLSIGEVKLPNLYGENEGGVAGKIHARYGTENPDPVDFYNSYLAKNDLPPLAYPYQSYLAFTGLGTPNFGGGWAGNIIGAAHGYYNNAFYLGNSGYMKEMLLWVKRTRIRNDGREQWYGEKAEIGNDVQRYYRSNEYQPFKLGMNGNCSWIDPTGAHDVSWGSGTFPFIEVDQSYEYDYVAGKVVHLREFPRSPGILDTSVMRMVSKYGMDFSNIPLSQVEPLTWIDGLPYSDEMWGGAVIRSFKYEGVFFWGGGIFDAKLVTTRGVSIEITKKGANQALTPGLIELSDHISASRYYLDISPGMYEIKVFIGGRYPSFAGENYPRPYAQMYLRGKTFTEIEYSDINPIHKIREILTDDTAMNKPESDVNDINFMKAADRIWDEGLGISWSITDKSCLEAINELCGHIEAGVRVNRQTGLYEMVLFRDDWFEESEIHTLAVNKIKSMSLEVANADEAINQLNVSYYNRESIKDSSFSIAENASIRNLNGRVNAEDADFPYFMNQRNAAVVAQWKLKQMSSPVWKGSFTTAEYNARKWNRYDLLKLAWPRKWQGTITVRIMKINLGTGADVSIDFVEIVPYSSNLSSDIVIDEPVDIAPQPPLACQYEPFEMPYYLAVMALGQRQVDEELSYENNFGLAAVVAEKPQSNSLYAVMMTHSGIEGEEWVRAATINYEPVADLDQNISRTSTSFTVKDSAVISGLPIGTLIKCGSEWMVLQGIDQETGVVSVKRGALDSIPQGWGINTKLYFCGNDVAFDATEYVAGEEVLVSALTTTPSGMLEQKGSIAIEMNARAFRPYPPANVKINNEYWPDFIEGGLQITWSNRNRLQQTGGEILGYFEGSVTLELNTQTLLTIIEFDANDIALATHSVNVAAANSYTLEEANMQNGVDSIHIVLKTVRGGYECMSAFDHIVRISNLVAPADVNFEVIKL